MTSLARRVARAIAAGADAPGRDPDPLIAPGAGVAIAVSGGADSVALVFLLRELSGRAPWHLAGLIHVHHGIRGTAADEDAAFCTALGARLGLPVETARVDVPSRMTAAGESVEVAARALRYEALEAAARRLGADVVATGHTLDDQAETVMLRLLRGAGGRGLSGVRRRRGRWVRPLLDVRRSELRSYLADLGEAFRDDASNADWTIPRNRLRHGVMPGLDAMSPGAAAALARSAELAARDEAWIQSRVIRESRSVVLSGEGDVSGDGDSEAGDAVTRVDADALAALPEPVARRLIGRLLENVSGHACALVHLDAIRRLVCSGRPGHLDLHGATVDLAAGELRLRPAGPPGQRATAAPVPPGVRAESAAAAAAHEATLPVPGVVEWPAAGVWIEARLETGRMPEPGVDRAALQAGRLVLPLRVRRRRPGDRVRPLGAPGSRKLQDVFVDRKVPREMRDAVPVIVDAEGHVVWVAGLAIAHDCRVTDPRKGMVVLELRR